MVESTKHRPSFDTPLALKGCVYRKPKPEDNDDEARRKSGGMRWHRYSELPDGWEHIEPANGELY